MDDITQPGDPLEMLGASLSEFIESQLTALCGETRGFALLICKGKPNTCNQDAVVLSNIDPESLLDILRCFVASRLEAEPVQFHSTASNSTH